MRADLALELQHCRGLPSPPGIALQLLQLARDPDAIMASASKLIVRDAALTARMLRVANSPLYAGGRRVENLSQALTLLGLNATLTLALGFTLARQMSSPDMSWARKHSWKRSVVASLAARQLGERIGLRQLEELMLAGLLQDIGVLALSQLYPDQYLPMLAQAVDNASLLHAEREAFGADHAQVGLQLARHWNLPDALCDAIGMSESEVSVAEFQACVQLSGTIADIWLSDDTHAVRQRAQADCLTYLSLPVEQFDSMVQDVHTMLPDVCEVFEVQVSSPTQLLVILEDAKELAQLRMLHDLQAANHARAEADEFKGHAHRLTEEARRDPLTGIFNRAELESVLHHEFKVSQRQSVPLSLAFLDLDQFKQVNDRWGHLVGDEVLRNFAQALQDHLRGGDMVARYGGEEFMIVLPGVNAATASKVISRILSKIASQPMTVVRDQPLYVTFSAGLATQDSEHPFATIEALLTSADQALYAAKRDGRNRVVSA